MSDLNPYRQPSPPADQPLLQVAPFSTTTCPKCGFNAASKVGFNWWGGALGPRLFHVVKCNRCAAQYNGKTGGTLTTVIIVYQLVAIVVFGTIIGGLAYYARSLP